MELTPDNTHTQFVAVAWEKLAFIAWSEYLAKGRGIIFVDFTTADFKSETSYEVKVSFVAEMELERMGADWNIEARFFGDLVADALRYDPTQQIALCLRFPTGEITAQVAVGLVPPPEVFLQRAGIRPTSLVSIVEAVLNN
jgi:hypothetical protein